MMLKLGKTEGRARLSRSVIPSVAPRKYMHHRADGRGVEGSPRCIGSQYSVRELSREFPEAVSSDDAPPGSFDFAPVNFLEDKLKRRYAQDDRGRVNCSRKAHSDPKENHQTP